MVGGFCSLWWGSVFGLHVQPVEPGRSLSRRVAGMELETGRNYKIEIETRELIDAEYVGQVFSGPAEKMEPQDAYVFHIGPQHYVVPKASIVGESD